jgi:hypothetical protein
MMWSLGWTIAPLYYSALQATIGFTNGYAVDFVTIIVLYSVATALLWTWFRGTDTAAPRETVPVPIPTEAPALVDHA